MRLNRFIATATGLSRRTADQAITDNRVTVNEKQAAVGQQIEAADVVRLDGITLTASDSERTVLLLNKPVGYVCSRDGQGNKTVYDLLPSGMHNLKPIGRLDKNSSGLLLLTDDGQLAYELTHPKFQKTKVYKIALNKPLTPKDETAVKQGVSLEDGPSKLELERINFSDNNNWKVTMTEGRNHQIRRTFEALGYSVVKLHRTKFGQHEIKDLGIGKYRTVD